MAEELTTGMRNLDDWWNKSSAMDREYGASAYLDYHTDVAHRFFPLPKPVSCAVFALTSPNNDYDGNIRSADLVIRAFAAGKSVAEIANATTYRACMSRAYKVLEGYPIPSVFGPTAQKTWNFYNNVLDPANPHYVTIDGHMYNLWRGERSTLKDAAQSFRPRIYEQIAEDFRRLARMHRVLPNQLQATLWWTWKRINRIRFKYQIEMEF